MATTLTAQAAIVWTGATDNDVFTDTNWDFTGAVNGTSSIAGNTAVNEDLNITGATVTGAAGGFGALILGDGFSLNLDNTNITMSGTSGLQGVDDGAGTARINAPMSVNATNGSTINIQFSSVGVDLNIDATSSLTIRGGGDGINSQTEITRVDLAAGGMLTMTNAAEIDEQIGEGDIYVDGVQVTAANKATLLSGAGSTVTALAVPEPSSTALLGLGGLALILRRRK